MTCPPMIQYSYTLTLYPYPKCLYKINAILSLEIQSNCTAWFCSIIQTLYQWPVLHPFVCLTCLNRERVPCRRHVIDNVVAAADTSLTLKTFKMSRSWLTLSLRCCVCFVRHCTQDVAASVGNVVGVQLCTSRNIINASPRRGMTLTDLSSIMNMNWKVN
jgi:hypothetical protein